MEEYRWKEEKENKRKRQMILEKEVREKMGGRKEVQSR